MTATNQVLRMPPAPRWDPDSAENPFRWIVDTAPAVRDQRNALMSQALAEARHERRVSANLLKGPGRP